MEKRPQRMILTNHRYCHPRAIKIGIVSEYPFTGDGIESCLTEAGQFDCARLQFSDLKDVEEKAYALVIIDLTGVQLRRESVNGPFSSTPIATVSGAQSDYPVEHVEAQL